MSTRRVRYRGPSSTSIKISVLFFCLSPKPGNNQRRPPDACEASERALQSTSRRRLSRPRRIDEPTAAGTNQSVSARESEVRHRCADTEKLANWNSTTVDANAPENDFKANLLTREVPSRPPFTPAVAMSGVAQLLFLISLAMTAWSPAAPGSVPEILLFNGTGTWEFAGGFLAGDASSKSFNLTSGVRFDFYAAVNRGIHKAAVAIEGVGTPPLEQYWEDGPQFPAGARSWASIPMGPRLLSKEHPARDGSSSAAFILRRQRSGEAE